MRHRVYRGPMNRYLKARIRGRPKKLYSATRHLVVSGGKRLRPYLVLQSCTALGGRSSYAMSAAGAVEMVHNFTLVHDDIMDNDEVRHGVPTVHKKFGTPVAILAGDVLFSKAYQVVSGARLPGKVSINLVRRLSDACVEVCEGQMLDIQMAQDSRFPSKPRYIEMVRKKTAALFDASCAMGAICAGAGPADVENFSSFGANLGVAFQITDDLIGVMGDPSVTKKPVGNDIREGKKSLPILLAIKKASRSERLAIRGPFGNPGASESDIASAVDTIRGLGIEESVRRTAVQYTERARAALDAYDSPARDRLVGLLDFVVDRRL